MSAKNPLTIVLEKDYLTAEHDSEIRHEFVEAVLFATVRANRAHNLIGSNLVAALHRQARDAGFPGEEQLQYQLDGDPETTITRPFECLMITCY